jgi:opacity protein-like surface antigen
MKSLLLTVVAVFGLATAVQAQETSIGAIAGYNFSKVENAVGSGLGDQYNGFHVGAIAEFKQTDKWSFELAAIYSTEGESTTVNDQEQTLALTFVNVPLHVKYYISEKFSVHGGPQMGFLLNAEMQQDGMEDMEIDGAVSSSFALTGGIGYDFSNGLFFKGTFALGVTDIIEDVNFNMDQRPATAHVSVGYKF